VSPRFSLWRILGNDLPPRHRPGQTRENLAFVLAHEPPLPDCRTHWILNRIVDRREEEGILAMLERSGQPHRRIPFRLDEYRRCLTEDDDLALTPQQGDAQRRRRHAKCLYVMNLNAARNLAIEEGRQAADWVLPLDGNCCFTPDGWQRLAERLAEERDHRRCLAIPMYRLKDNVDYFGFSTSHRQAQEPQVVVGRDCALRFNPAYRYGQDSKTEFLVRAGFPFVKNDAHEVTDAGVLCGYVVRLWSGVDAGEGHWTIRAGLRERGIDRILDTADRLANAEGLPATAEAERSRGRRSRS
jgi:hypothetical protein